jgi:hypothetical protein
MTDARIRQGFRLPLSAFVAAIATMVIFTTHTALADDTEIPSDGATTPASRYANLTNEEAFAELDRRHILYERVESAPGVRAPIRLAGKLHGVFIHSSLPTVQRKTTEFEILDARLAIALDDFAAVLENHGVVELVHYTMYRPHDNDDLPEGDAVIQTRHPGGMAIDVGVLKKKNGAKLSVEEYWPAAIGARTCGARARHIPTRRGREIVSIVCEAKDLRLFHALLTPHYNEAHHDHVHMEIKPETRWFIVH